MSGEKRRKIGILGGTFDPVHTAHLMIADHAASDLSLDQVYLMPTGKSPHKDEASITPISHRVNMIELAIAGNPKLALSTFELEDPEISYTYRTAERLSTAYPDTDFYYIMGADSLIHFRDWVHPEIISRHFRLAVAVRDGADSADLLSLAADYDRLFQTQISVLSVPNFSISSTDIRNRIAKGLSVRYLTPDPVIEYLKTHRLYGAAKAEENGGNVGCKSS